jgi:hypothetical protein
MATANRLNWNMTQPHEHSEDPPFIVTQALLHVMRQLENAETTGVIDELRRTWSDAQRSPFPPPTATTARDLALLVRHTALAIADPDTPVADRSDLLLHAISGLHVVTASTDDVMWAAVAVGLDADDDPLALVARLLWVLDDLESIALELDASDEG